MTDYFAHYDTERDSYASDHRHPESAVPEFSGGQFRADYPQDK